LLLLFVRNEDACTAQDDRVLSLLFDFRFSCPEFSAFKDVQSSSTRGRKEGTLKEEEEEEAEVFFATTGCSSSSSETTTLHFLRFAIPSPALLALHIPALPKLHRPPGLTCAQPRESARATQQQW
jgi:hypothetical protein